MPEDTRGVGGCQVLLGLHPARWTITPLVHGLAAGCAHTPHNNHTIAILLCGGPCGAGGGAWSCGAGGLCPWQRNGDLLRRSKSFNASSARAPMRNVARTTREDLSRLLKPRPYSSIAAPATADRWRVGMSWRRPPANQGGGPGGGGGSLTAKTRKLPTVKAQRRQSARPSAGGAFQRRTTHYRRHCAWSSTQRVQV